MIQDIYNSNLLFWSMVTSLHVTAFGVILLFREIWLNWKEFHE